MWMIQIKIRSDGVGKEIVLLIRSCIVRDLVLDKSSFDSTVVFYYMIAKFRLTKRQVVLW